VPTKLGWRQSDWLQQQEVGQFTGVNEVCSLMLVNRPTNVALGFNQTVFLVIGAPSISISISIDLLVGEVGCYISQIVDQCHCFKEHLHESVDRMRSASLI